MIPYIDMQSAKEDKKTQRFREGEYSKHCQQPACIPSILRSTCQELLMGTPRPNNIFSPSGYRMLQGLGIGQTSYAGNPKSQELTSTKGRWELIAKYPSSLLL